MALDFRNSVGMNVEGLGVTLVSVARGTDVTRGGRGAMNAKRYPLPWYSQ